MSKEQVMFLEAIGIDTSKLKDVSDEGLDALIYHLGF